MIYRLAADAIAIVHLAFVAYVVLGGLLALRWRRAAWLHIPAALWGVGIEVSGGICPLTPLENFLRQKGGTLAYSGGFVEQYVLPLLYPEHLGRPTQLALGAAALIINLVVYGLIGTSLHRSSRRRGRPSS